MVVMGDDGDEAVTDYDDVVEDGNDEEEVIEIENGNDVVAYVKRKTIAYVSKQMRYSQ